MHRSYAISGFYVKSEKMMRAFAKFDLIGFLILSIATTIMILHQHSLFCTGMVIASIACFSKSAYDSRRRIWMYRKAIHHYQSILASSVDSWIAWNTSGEMIGMSKQFKSQFLLKNSDNISLDHILKELTDEDAALIRQNFELLRSKGLGFSVTVSPISTDTLIEVSCYKTKVNEIETLSMWARNVTSVSHAFENIQIKLDKVTEESNIMSKILDELPVSVWYRDKNLKICYCNNEYAKILETDKKNIIEKNIPLVAGSLFGQGHSLAENVKKTGKKQSIAQFSVISGKRHKLNIYESPVSSDIVGYAIDITELDEALSNMDRVIVAQSEVLESLSTSIAIFNPSMKLNFYNSAYRKMTKFDEIWLNSKPSYGEVLDKQRVYRQIPECADFNAYKKDQIQMFTSLMSPVQDLVHLPNGSVLRRFIAPYPLGGLIFLYDDITDSLNLKRENSTILAVQRETINNLIEGVIVFGSDNRLKFMNPTISKLWNTGNSIKQSGVHISEFLDFNKEQIDYVGDWKIYKDNIVSNLTDRIRKTGRILKKDGSVIFFSYTPLPDGSHMHSYTDITDTCKVELALHEKNQAIHMSNNLKYEFISNLSSEIRNPINIIIGFSDLLRCQYFGQLNQKQISYCNGVVESCKKLLDFVDNLSYMNDIDLENICIDKSFFDAQKTLNDIIEMNRGRAVSNGIDLIAEYSSEIHNIYGDRKIFRQVIFNLVCNFIKCMNESSIVKVVIDVEKNNLKLVISATNTTVKHKSKLKIFQRMSLQQVAKFTVSEQISLGVPIVKSLIEKHGGTVDIKKGNNSRSIICNIPIEVAPKDCKEIAA